MAHNIQQLQMAIEEEYKAIQALQAEYKRLDDGKQKLIEQQSENNIVKKEIDLLEEDAVIYKQYGPVLVKQDNGEAKNNVTKRLEFINAEILKMDGIVKTNENKQTEKRAKLQKLQDQFQRIRQQLMQMQQQQAPQPPQ